MTNEAAKSTFSESKKEVDVYTGYAYEFNFALIVSLLLYNVFLLLRIKYGEKIINRMTTMPYKMSAFLLIFSLIESIVDLYLVSRRTVQLNSDPTQFSWSNTILVFVSYFKICSIQYFFVARAFE